MNADTRTTTKQTATVAEGGAADAPNQAKATKAASRKNNAPKAKRGAKKTAATKQAKTAANPKPKRTDAKVNAAGRSNSKKTAVLDLLHRKDGATMGEIAKATGWQNHSIRGFISGTIGKKMALNVESAKSQSGERTYRIVK